ncbi:hypothetical protein [Desulfurivibrio dismutans]|uniref:hypothetical protein n=1 Tax=Desulfurivibrio dismutans TaxID=1398908 RepID=UPI0023DB9FC8|nr:hypothetical protein [Desulfurivibrio alkaliphilus]MDF1614770.1 hypothetical protein [Desulfurivibrio alkaliphilus]
MSDEHLADRRFDLGRDGILYTKRVFHRYPGKRALVHGQLNGVPVVAKFYVAPVAQAYEWYRGLRGTKALIRSGVATPALHYAGYRSEVSAWLTVQEWIEADEFWPPAEDEHSGAAHARLIQTLVTHHLAGIIQNDLNWLNFIPHQGSLYAIDGDRVRRQRSPLGPRQGLGHLVRLYASKSKLPETTVREGFRQYMELRRWSFGSVDEERFIARVQRARRRHAEEVAHRACRGWKHYPRRRHDGFTIIRDRRCLDQAQARRLLASLRKESETQPNGGTIEQDGRTVRWQPIGEIPDRISPVQQWLNGRRACHTWVALLTAHRLGLFTERHLALILPGLVTRGAVATVMVQKAIGASPLPDCLHDMDTEDLTNLLGQLHDRLAVMKASRITIGPAGLSAFGWDGRRLHIIDALAIELYPLRRSGFTGHWRCFLEELQKDLVAAGVVPSELTVFAPIVQAELHVD